MIHERFINDEQRMNATGHVRVTDGESDQVVTQDLRAAHRFSGSAFGRLNPAGERGGRAAILAQPACDPSQSRTTSSIIVKKATTF
jgi:hypothetical protein